MHGRRAIFAVPLVVSLVVAACGSPTPSPSGSATPVASNAASDGATPSPAPSASAAATPAGDPLVALNSTLSSASWSSHATVSGTLTLASTPYAIDGSFDVSGFDSHEVRTVKLAGAGSGEWLTVGDKRFVRSADGVWFGDAAPTSRDDLRKFLSLASGFNDLGPSTTASGANHFRLESAVLGPRALGLTNLVVAVPFATLDVDADADGNPIELRVTATWSATRSGKQTPVSVAMTYAFDRGTGPTVFGPDEVWTMSTSKLFKYRLGAPETWAVRPATSLKYVDTVEGDDYLYIGASRERTYGDSLSRIATYFKTHRLLVDFKSWKFVSMKSVTIAGAPGRVITAHAVSGSDKLTVMLYLAIRGSWVYEVAIIDLQGNEAAQAAFGSKVISTFRFPG